LGREYLEREFKFDSYIRQGILDTVEFHHERWDGCGYNSGLHGDKIPLMARIVSIADSYDAMTSLRAYKEPISSDDALVELEYGAGSQFDPSLVEVVIWGIKNKRLELKV